MAIKITVNNNSAYADDSTIAAVVAEVKNICTFASEDDAKEALCALAQAGGTNNAQGNLSISREDSGATPPKTVTLTLKQAREALKKNKITYRQFARTLSQQCHDVGVQYDIPGDLYKRLQHLYGPISKADSYWCASFQMESDNCPQHIKDMLKDHYNKTFKKNP